MIQVKAKDKKNKKYAKLLEDIIRKDFRTPIIEEFTMKMESWRLILGDDLLKEMLRIYLED